MRLCSCGFANADDASACAACGAPFAAAIPGTALPTATASALVLEEVRGGVTVTVTAPGGVLGRAGDFAPEAFSPRVSGVHAVVAMSDTGRWTIEHTGRNASSVERAGAWTTLRAGAPHPLFGGEMLKLADMTFRVSLAYPESESAAAAADCPGAPPVPEAAGTGADPSLTPPLRPFPAGPCAAPSAAPSIPWPAPPIASTAAPSAATPSTNGGSPARRPGPPTSPSTGARPCSSTASTIP